MPSFFLLHAAWGPSNRSRFSGLRCRLVFIYSKSDPFSLVIPLGELVFFVVCLNSERVTAWIFLDDGKVCWFIAHRWRLRGLRFSNEPSSRAWRRKYPDFGNGHGCIGQLAVESSGLHLADPQMTWVRESQKAISEWDSLVHRLVCMGALCGSMNASGFSTIPAHDL